MSINFPNDPASNPGDGGTWVDGDGNTWTVEIVSGEAIWTMTEAADTGGGGGDVTSVAGKTGAVDLELKDLTDVDTDGATTNQVLKYNGSSFAPADDETSPLDALLSVDGDAVKYGTAPTLGVDATDVVIPTMGQVRAAIAANGGTSVSFNDLSDVNYTQKGSDDSWTLEPINLDEILFSGQDTPSTVTRKIYTNSIYGMAMASYEDDDDGSYVYTHETKGIVLRSPSDNGVLWIEGDRRTTTSQPEIRITNGNGFEETPTGNYIGFKMPAGVDADVTWTLPAVDGAASSVLTSDGAGNLSFQPQPEVAIPTTTYEIGYESTTAYKFTGPGLDGTELNPTLYVIRGQKYIFSNVLGAHPFQLQTVAGTGESPYTDGVTGDQPIDLGSFEWEVPMGAPSKLYYQCTAHAAMAGIIEVLDNSGDGGGAGAVDSVNLQTGVVSLGIQDMNDYALRVPPVDGSVVKMKVGVDYTPGLIFEYAGSEIYISTVDKDGAALVDLPAPADPANGTFFYTIDGETRQVTYTSILDALNGFYRFFYDSDNSDISALRDINNEDKDVVIKFGDAPPLIPLAEGDVLQWDSSDQKFKPTALASVATSGDYNDLINTPTGADAPVTSVNTETGDVSLGIQDMDDVITTPEVDLSVACRFTYMGFGSEPSSSTPGTYSYTSGFGANRYRINETDADGVTTNTRITQGHTGTVYVSFDGIVWDELTLSSAVIEEFGKDYLNLNIEDGQYPFDDNALTNPVDNTVIYWAVTDPRSGKALADKDVLQWNNSISKFEPAALDYSQINNTPAVKTRITPSVTTAALAVDATETGELTGTGATGFLISVQTDTAAWVRLYCTPDAMTADASRDIDTDPVPGSGVLFEALYSTFTEKPITPGTTYFNLSGLDKLYYRITNKSAIADTPITVTFKLLPME